MNEIPGSNETAPESGRDLDEPVNLKDPESCSASSIVQKGNHSNKIREGVVESIRKAEIEYKARHPGAVFEAGSSARPMLNPIQLGASLV